MRYSFITTVLVFLIFFFHYNKNDIKSYLNFKNFIYLMSFMSISIFLLINIELFQQWRFLKLFISPDVGQMSGLFEIINIEIRLIVLFIFNSLKKKYATNIMRMKYK